MTGRIELRWGLIIGAANLIWLYGSYYLGMHTSGLAMIQMVMLASLLFPVVGYVPAMRSIARVVPDMSFIEGIRSGAIIVGIVAVFAVISQLGYHKFIFPEFTEYMAGEIGKYYQDQGLTEVEDGARQTFGLRSCLIQSALGAMMVGMITITVFMGVFCLRRRA